MVLDKRSMPAAEQMLVLGQLCRSVFGRVVFSIDCFFDGRAASFYSAKCALSILFSSSGRIFKIMKVGKRNVS